MEWYLISGKRRKKGRGSDGRTPHRNPSENFVGKFKFKYSSKYKTLVSRFLLTLNNFPYYHHNEDEIHIRLK